MHCQIPGCKNMGHLATKKDGIFSGIHLENVMIWTCNEHSKEEIEKKLKLIGEEESSLLQHENPYCQAQKFYKKSS